MTSLPVLSEMRSDRASMIVHVSPCLSITESKMGRKVVSGQILRNLSARLCSCSASTHEMKLLSALTPKPLYSLKKRRTAVSCFVESAGGLALSRCVKS